ncbi:MAG: hypothetical protein COB40_10405 [Marinosulfonomonas sp.]|nr:MAG: hypothetical protein COB40_10405 [Marinosulfonomonas sp.]
MHHHFLPEIIEHAVWLYFRISLSLYNVEDRLGERGIADSHEADRFWNGKTLYFLVRSRRNAKAAK